ncbi:Imm52 family immunity protein [Methylovirgula sp. HY1]|uniref:Imm52 family immunity protein n=1 Tax=Methylovirgula sp. HY1 TaxID=2822761 RepID=UPI001C5B4F99|nr:Imm52 family immunity protein [Methylovirgula sp. HY1]QXX74319.1 hypothetical protein MHY1_01130 [Methylovirgula sp. HY1]
MKRSQFLKPGRGYHTGVFWGPREEKPEELAARWLKLIARLQAVDPIFAHWYVWVPYKPALPIGMQAAPLAEKIAANVATDDSDEPEPRLGYQLFAHNTEIKKRGPRNFEVHMNAGSFGPWLSNMIGIGTDYGVVPDPDVVAYRIFRGALLALAETFEATIGSAYPTSLIDLWPKENRRAQLTLKLAWITYVAPRFVPLITPPASAIVERRPDGGLLMAATDETFVTTNPAHVAVAREIEAAVAPFNALPYP